MRTKINLFQNQKRTTAHLVVGLVFGISLYAFLFVLIETFRHTSRINDLDYWLLEPEKTFWGYVAIAGYSLVFGHAIFWKLQLSSLRAKRASRNYLLRVASIDQSNLTWYSLMFIIGLASNLAYIFMALFGDPWQSLDFNFILQIMALVAIVIFLNSWTGLLRLQGKKGIMNVFVSFVIVSCMSFGLACWSPIYSDKTDSVVKESLPQLKNDLDYPTVSNYESIVKRSWIITL